jgi:hypothetical protein
VRYYGIQTVQFEDGTNWNNAQLVALEDYESGGGVNDVFVINSGYGHLEISENDSGSNQENVLRLGLGSCPRSSW